jgi:hypothetical protein
MSKRIGWILVCGLVVGEGYSQVAPDWEWAKNATGAGSQGSFSVASDLNGNSYITGEFYSPTVTFGSIALTNIDATGNTWDIFIAKYDAYGNVLWAKGGGGKHNDLGYSVAVDAFGNSFITGYFRSDTIIFGNDTLINSFSPNQDIFIAKFDSNGNELWAKSAGGIYDEIAYCVTTDASGNAYLGGDFGSQIVTFDTIALTNTHIYTGDLFIVKYNASGNVIWAKSAGGDYLDEIFSIAVDPNRNVFIAGCFTSPALTFGNITLTNAGMCDMFTTKYDSTGNVLWAKSNGGINSEFANSIAVDTFGNAYVSGSFASPVVNFDTLIVINTFGSDCVFITKYNGSGNILWVRTAGGVNGDYSSGVVADANGNSYITGVFTSPTITFGATTLTNVNATVGFGYADIFITKYDASGNMLWAQSVGGTGADASNGIDLDGYGSTYITGYFESSSLNFGNYFITNSGAGDAFVAKLDNTTGISEKNNSFNSLQLSPNPTSGTIQLTFNTKHNGAVECEIRTVMGERVYEKELQTLNFKLQTTLDVSFLENGIYFVKVIADGKSMVQKVVKM